MRITNEEQQAIRDTIRQADAGAIIYLFGPRVDDAALGGDIDLLALPKKINLMDKLDILARLRQRIGARKYRHRRLFRYHTPIPENGYTNRRTAMTREKFELLQKELASLQSAANRLVYARNKMPGIYSVVTALTPTLLSAVPEVIAYANDLTRRHHP